jgi:hypothetical protein
MNLANFKLALLAADARKEQRRWPLTDSELEAKSVRVAANLLCVGRFRNKAKQLASGRAHPVMDGLCPGSIR